MRNVPLYMSMSHDGYVRLLVQPLALGQGQALFGQLAAARRPDLVEARVFTSGVVLQVYRPQRGRVGSEA